jgi:carbonic anhydrase
MDRHHRSSTASMSRRGALIGAGTILAGTFLSPTSARAGAPAAAAATLAPTDALERLKQGNARYAAGGAQPKDFSPKSAASVEARNPIAAVLTCSDNPIPAPLLFDQGPGDLVVVANAGNIVTATSLASLEYAVADLGVLLLLVLGHSDCRAVGVAFEAVRERKELPGNLPELVKAIELAVITAHGQHPSDLLAATIEENARIGKKRLTENSPVLSEAVAAGKIAIAAAIHDLASGKVQLI